jgi:putative ABC transport system permease protein
MNVLELVLKQMRQRALGTWLTTLSVVLGVALATAVLVFQREGKRMFVQSDFGFEVLVGPTRGSPLQLTLNTIYNLDVSPGLLDYKVFEDLVRNRGTVRQAIPIAKGDTYAGLPIIGTVPRMFNYTNDDSDTGPQPIITDEANPNRQASWEYRIGRSFKLETGAMFHPRKFQAVIGADVPRLARINIGDRFKATHGNPGPNETPDIHDQEWTVVGRLERTNTAADKAIYIPLMSFFAIGEHEEAVETVNRLRAGADISRLGSPGGLTRPTTATAPAASPAPAPAADAGQYRMDGDYIVLNLPKEEWLLSAVLVDVRSAPLAFSLMYAVNNSNKASASNPAQTMRSFFDTFLTPSSQVLLAVAGLVSVVAAVGILVAIYNSVSARTREIAILRALGATRARVLSIICLEAGLIGVIGTVFGVLAGLLLVTFASGWVPANLGQIQAFRWESVYSVDLFGWASTAFQGRIRVPVELLYLAGVVVLSVLAGLVPALKAYRVPVATNLTA